MDRLTFFALSQTARDRVGSGRGAGGGMLSTAVEIQMFDIFPEIYSLSVNIIQHPPKYLLIRGSVEGKNDIIQE